MSSSSSSSPTASATGSTTTSAPELALRVPPLLSATHHAPNCKLDFFGVSLSKRAYSPGEKVGGRVHVILGGREGGWEDSAAAASAAAALDVKALWLDYNTVCDICYRDRNDVRRTQKKVPVI